MKENPSDRRLAENEVIFRRLNEQAHAGLTTVNMLASEDRQPELKIRDDASLYFYCECSNLSCTERMRITFGEYGGIHRNRNHFVVVPGHEISKIERITKKCPNYYVVRKFIDPPEQV